MKLSHHGGFTIIELLVSTAVLGIMMAGVTAAFIGQQRTNTRQELGVGREENLRVAEAMIVDALRGSGYGMPEGGTLADWVPWVTIGGHVGIAQGTGTAPDTLTVAGCFREPVAVLSSTYTPLGSMDTVTLTPTSGSLSDHLDGATRSLVLIDYEPARVLTVGTGAITIDANPDPDVSGAQPLADIHTAGAEVCRVDVLTFSIVADALTGGSLVLDENHGDGAQVVAEGITNLQIAALGYGRYEVQITGQTERRDPITGTTLSRTASAIVSRRNS